MPMRRSRLSEWNLSMPPVSQRDQSLLEFIEDHERLLGTDGWICDYCHQPMDRFGGWVAMKKLCYACYWSSEAIKSDRLC